MQRSWCTFFIGGKVVTKIAIFASGNGSNFQAIVDAIAAGDLAAEVKLLVCDQNDAYVIERAKQQGIDTFIFQAQAFSVKDPQEPDNN